MPVGRPFYVTYIYSLYLRRTHTRSLLFLRRFSELFSLTVLSPSTVGPWRAHASGANKFVRDNYITYNRDRQLTAVVTTLFISPRSPSTIFDVHLSPVIFSSCSVRKRRYHHLSLSYGSRQLMQLPFFSFRFFLFYKLQQISTAIHYSPTYVYGLTALRRH